MSNSVCRPLYSIVIPVYNAFRYLEMTLKSIYAQTYGNFEIIAVNDGSSDGSAELLALQTDVRLRVFHQKNSGVSVARNRGIQEARGEFVAFIDADDCWNANHLEIVNRFFLLYPEYNWFVSDYMFADDISESMINSGVKGPLAYKAVNWFLSANNVPMSGNYVMRKASIPSGEFFPPGVVMCEDNVACARMAMVNPMIGTVECKTVYYRMHSDSASHVYSFSALGRTSAIKEAFLLHQSMFRDAHCSPEGRLFFRWYSLSNWWSRIRSCSMWEWRTEICERQSVTGVFLSLWLLMCGALSELMCRIAGKVLRLEINKLNLRMRKKAKHVTVYLGEFLIQ